MSNNNNNHKIFSSGTTGDAQVSTQNVSFRDNNPGMLDYRPSRYDATRDDGFLEDVTLSSWFSRPVKIFEQDWPVGVSYFARINPWQLFWENARNIEKISNYHLLKCKMHIKLMVNGNAFYYGRLICAYEPLAERDNTAPTVGRSTAYLRSDLVRLSQRMHFYVNPTESSGGSMELPFFYDRNCLEIPSKEWRRMGDLVLMSLSSLEHATGGTNPVTISILAWATDVSYAIPTASIPEMIEFGRPEQDEHNTNVVSRPASTVARYARALSNLPMIGPFAKATEIGAGAVAAVAKIFGYSSPNELEYSVMVPNPRPSLAVVDTKVPANKLTFDSKQELTIDPSTTGINPDDEMPIASIAGRESYLTSFDWSIGDGPDTLLFRVRVDPFMFRTEGDEYHFPACAAAVLPFKYWRGTMRYRIQIVSSAYHKGRLRVTYDPGGGTGAQEYNTHYTTIHDIADEKDFTIDVGWGQADPYREHLTKDDTPFTDLVDLVKDPTKGNGVLSFYVMNALTIPGTVISDIFVNVFVSALDDFEVASPTSDYMLYKFRPPFGSSVPEMAEEAMGDMDCCSEAIADPPAIDQFADNMIASPDITKLFFGEVVGSFRQVIKRDNLSEVLFLKERGDTTALRIQRAAFPSYGGFYDGASFVDSQVLTFLSGRKYVPCATTALNYVSRMFLGWRGSIRWTIDTGSLSLGNNDRINSTTVTYCRNFASNRNHDFTDLSSNTQNNGVALLNLEDGFTGLGAYLGNTSVNPIHTFEVPFYSNKRFISTIEQFAYNQTVEEPSFVMSFILPASSVVSERSFLKFYCSAGEDFNLFFFNGMPPMYYDPSIPTV